MRIIHITDLHFGLHNPAIITPFLADLELLQPDIIIISGDLTQRATNQQYRQLNNFRQKLRAQVLIVPGNHDIPMHAFSRLFNPFKLYKSYISQELECSFSNEEINILGVNSATPYKIKDGRLSNKTLTLIKNHFSATSKQLNILFFHHNLNYFSGMHHPLNNAEQFIEYLKESPIHIVCTGHLHYATLKLVNKKSPGQCAILHGGSLMCQRSKDKINSFYVIDTENLTSKIEWRVFSHGCFIAYESYEVDFTMNTPDS